MEKFVEIKRQEALDYHKNEKPGKLEIQATKTLNSQRDLSLAYSPGVAVPCEEIAIDPSSAYEYTCLLYTSPSPRDGLLCRMPSSA